MANSIITTYGDGTTNVFPISFTLGFISRSHVQCRVNNEVDGSMNPVYRELEWINDGLVRVLGTTPGSGVTVVFTRTVPKDILIHDYSNGAAIEEQNLDDSNLQVLHAIGEFLDGRFTNDLARALNMNNNKVINVADATDDQDAVNLRVLESRVGDAPAEAAAAEAAREAAEDALAAAEAVLLQVQTIYDNFDDRYLGAKTSDPTVDNDGNALIDGALYYNTASNVMRIYDLGTTSWNNVTTSVLDGSITTAKLAASAVTAAKLADGAVSTAAKIASAVVTEVKLGLSDNTTNDATALRHGFLKKLSGNTAEFMRGDGNWATPVAGKFISAPQTITPAGALVLPHSLGVNPTEFASYLTCTTADAGYPIGARVPFSLGSQVDLPSTNSGVFINSDAINLNIRFGETLSPGTLIIGNGTTGVQTGITNASWTITFIARI